MSLSVKTNKKTNSSLHLDIKQISSFFRPKMRKQMLVTVLNLIILPKYLSIESVCLGIKPRKSFLLIVMRKSARFYSLTILVLFFTYKSFSKRDEKKKLSKSENFH